MDSSNGILMTCLQTQSRDSFNSVIETETMTEISI